MTEPAALPAPRKRRRRLLWLLVPLALLVCGCLYLSFAGQWRLTRAIAEADRLDPHWRLDAIRAESAALADEENAALLVTAAKGKMPPNWGPLVQAENIVSARLPPNVALTEGQTAALRDCLEPGAAALPAARQLADHPRGRWPQGAPLFDVLETAKLLDADARLRSAEGDLDGALASCRASVNCGRSSSDEPGLLPQSVRLAAGAMAAREAERVLGQGEPSEDALAALQKLLIEEMEAPLVTIALRGERASLDHLMESLQRGNTTVRQMKAQFGSPASSRFSLGWTDLFYLPGVTANSRAATLEQMNQLVEISKLPPQQRAAPLAELAASRKNESRLVLQLSSLVTMPRYVEDMEEKRAVLCCAAAGLAVERYRRKHGRWPDSLDDLTGDFLREVPADPLDGRPLRYLKTDEGAVVYSVGPDGRGDPVKGPDYISFRLWNVDKRRQPPPPHKLTGAPSPSPESRP